MSRREPLLVKNSASMVKNAEANVVAAAANNVRVSQFDVTEHPHQKNFDLVYTTRCLINLPTWELQQKALQNIRGILSSSGVYVMIENFIEGHESFNRVREEFGLSPISVRSHNLFFERPRLIGFASSRFELIEETNISSTYYLVSRIIYSKLCQDQSVQPDYFNEHHRYASALPFCGEYGPVRMICLKRA